MQTTLTAKLTAPDVMTLDVRAVAPADDCHKIAQDALRADLVAALAPEADTAKLRKLSTGDARLAGEKQAARAAGDAAQRDLDAATAAGDLDAMQDAQTRIKAANSRAGNASESSDLVKAPLAATRATVTQRAGVLALKLRQAALDKAEADVQRIRGQVEKAIPRETLAQLGRAVALHDALLRSAQVLAVGEQTPLDGIVLQVVKELAAVPVA
jgi:hypothetical protein